MPKGETVKGVNSSRKDGKAVLSCSKQNLIRYISLAVALILSIATVVIFFDSFGWGAMTRYPLEEHISNYNPYVQQFDAFMKGQFNIDYEPSEKFLALENPYDPAERSGTEYLYDRAYFEGKYYSYFGTAPIFTVMLPCYLLTGSLPSDAVIQLIYMLVFVLFMTALVFDIGQKVAKHTHPAVLAFISYVATVSSLQLMFARGRTPFYYIAATSAMAFLAMFAFFFFRGIFSKKIYSRAILFGAAGLAFALCFHSRVNTAFAAAFFIVPAVLFGIVLKKRESPSADEVQKTSLGVKIGHISIELCSLAFFVIIGFIIAFAYNYARFGSILDFGSKYQLTVADVSKYKLDIREIGHSVFNYFLSPLKNDDGTLNLGYSKISGLSRYLYVDGHFGILEIPFTWSAFATPFLFFDRSKSRLLRYSTVFAFIGCFAIAWIDFCLGGVIYRYLCDFSAIFAVLAAIGFILIFDKLWEIKLPWIRYILIGAVIIFLIASLFKTFQIMAITNGNLLTMDTDSLFYRLFSTDTSK